MTTSVELSSSTRRKNKVYTNTKNNNVKINIVRTLHILLPALGLIILLSACNSKDEPKNEVNTQNVPSVAISRFSLKSDNDVMKGLDSVFFSIDLRNGMIFNADSLPKGTNITKLKLNVDFDQEVSEVMITMEGGKHRTGTTSLRSNPNDTIDFSGKVTMDVTSADKAITYQYQIKVNVHKTDPDSLTWDKMAVRQLPSRMPDPADQKTVAFGDKVYTIITEKDGSNTIATTDTTDINSWNKQKLSLGFSPQIRTLTATEKALYILDSQNNLYASTDGTAWNATGKKWIGIVGGYGDYLLGIRENSQKLIHTSYPDNNVLKESEVESGFPVSGASNFVYYSNKWAVVPMGFLTGGRDSHGRISDSTWAFDGDNWCIISQTPGPALTDATMVRYISFRRVNNQSGYDEYQVWMILGGKNDEGKFNRSVYISYDNGVNWQKGSEYLQLPEYIPMMTQLDNVVLYTKMSGNIAGWKRAPQRALPPMMRIGYEIDGDTIIWDCPYIYLFGGRLEDGRLSNTIWKGVLNRLTFVPLI